MLTKIGPGGVLWWAAAVAVASLSFVVSARAEPGLTCDGVTATISGTTGDDQLVGTPGRDVIVARGGNDTIRGEGGNDLICAGLGNDIVFGGFGNDTIRGSDGNDRIWGNGGRDTLIGGVGTDRIAGGGGNDVIDGGPGSDRLNGDGGDDRLLGEGGDDLISGGAGNDLLKGGWGNNRMNGGEGNDHIVGGGRGESVNGGNGNDRIFGNGGNDWVRGGDGHDLIQGGDSAPGAPVCDPSDPDTCHTDPIDFLDGGEGADRIIGGHGADKIRGHAGFDTLEGGPGNDVILGGPNNDFLNGGAGEDTAAPGSGNDECLNAETLLGPCDKPSATVPLDDWRGSSESRAFATRLLDVMLFQSACNDDARHLAQMEATAAVAPVDVRPRLRAGVAALRRSVQACNVDDAAWAAALEGAVRHFNRLAPSAPAASETDPFLRATTRATASVEEMSHWLSGNTEKFKASALWVAGQHYGKHYDMADRADEGGYDVVMIGSSLVVSGFEPQRFVDVDGRSAFNAGVFAMGPEAIATWLEAVTRLAAPDTVLYGVAPRDIQSKSKIDGSCLDDASIWRDTIARQGTVFSPVTALEGIWWENLLFGDPMAAEPHDLYRAEFDELGGRGAMYQASVEEILESVSRGKWEGPFDQCAERYSVFSANVAAIEAAGMDAVVVFMPLSSYRIGMFEGGRAEVDAILADMETAATAAGAAAVIDLSGSVPDDEFRDLAHTNLAGARTFTEALIDRMTALGL